MIITDHVAVVGHAARFAVAGIIVYSYHEPKTDLAPSVNERREFTLHGSISERRRSQTPRGSRIINLNGTETDTVACYSLYARPEPPWLYINVTSMLHVAAATGV